MAGWSGLYGPVAPPLPPIVEGDQHVQDLFVGGGSPWADVRAAPFRATGDGVTDDTAAIQSAIDASEGRVLFPPGNYKYSALTLPVLSYGGLLLMGAGPEETILTQTGSGYGITIGDGGATDTRFVNIMNARLVGNSSAAGAVKFFHTRWCGIRDCDIRDYTNVSAHAVLIDSADHNYYNEIETCQFTNNRSHIKLHGDPSGIGANSNHVLRCHFSLATDQAILVDGGDTNRIHDCEFADATPVAVKFANAAALFNRVEGNHFDGPTKAWDVLGSSVTNTHFLWNTGTTAVEASTDLGTDSVRQDMRTESARVSVTNSGTQSINNATVTTLTWNTDTYDPVGMHDTGVNTDRLTAPMAGTYRVTALVEFAHDVDGVRHVRITKNGTSPILAQANTMAVTVASELTQVVVSKDVALAKDDYVICRVYHTAGAALNVSGGDPSSAFQMKRVG